MDEPIMQKFIFISLRIMFNISTKRKYCSFKITPFIIHLYDLQDLQKYNDGDVFFLNRNY